MVIIGFRLRKMDDEFFNTVKSSFNKRGDKWEIHHVQMFLPNHSSFINVSGRTPLRYREASDIEYDAQYEWVHISLKTDRYKQILKSRYGSDKTVFLFTDDGKNYKVV